MSAEMKALKKHKTILLIFCDHHIDNDLSII